MFGRVLQQVGDVLGQQVSTSHQFQGCRCELADVLVAIAIAFLDRQPRIARTIAIGPGARAALPELKAMVARGWKDLEDSKESEAKQLPEAVARAIKSIEAKGPRKSTKAKEN